MSDLNGFEKRMKLIAKGVSNETDRLVRKVALAVDASVVLATPVDTGRARSNWIVNLGTASSGVIEPRNPGLGGSTAGPNARDAIEQGKAVVATYKAGQEIHITNNLDYIKKLNEGSSAQAPDGFIEEAVQAGVKTIGDSRVIIT